MQLLIMFAINALFLESLHGPLQIHISSHNAHYVPDSINSFDWSVLFLYMVLMLTEFISFFVFPFLQCCRDSPADAKAKC
jgi:hypothetical protein